MLVKLRCNKVLLTAFTLELQCLINVEKVFIIRSKPSILIKAISTTIENIRKALSAVVSEAVSTAARLLARSMIQSSVANLAAKSFRELFFCHLNGLSCCLVGLEQVYVVLNFLLLLSFYSLFGFFLGEKKIKLIFYKILLNFGLHFIFHFFQEKFY